MTTRVSRVENVGFSSGNSGTGPATWGQQAIWDAVSKLGVDAHRYNISIGFPVEPGIPVARVLEAVPKLLQLHQSLRTRLVPDPDGELWQFLDAEGSVPVHLLEADADRAEEQGRELLAGLVTTSFDCAVDLPIRIAVVETGGLMTFVGFCLSHTAVDGWGLSRAVMDLFALAQGEPLERVREQHPYLQPLEEAAFQTSARGRQRDAAARGFWAKKLRLGPRAVFARPPAGPPAATFPLAVLNSPSLARAVDLVSVGHRAGGSSVLLAAASVMLFRLTGTPDPMFQVVVSNRFRSDLAHAVSTVAQEGLIHLPDADREFAEVVRRAQAVSLASYRHAYYRKRLLDQDIERMLEQEGAIADRSCIFNDRRDLVPHYPMEGDPSKLPLAQSRPLTTLSFPEECLPRLGTTFAMDAHHAPGSLELLITADTAHLPKPDIEAFLYGIEELVVNEAVALGAD
ncbi:non-ribosomal peptide synthetase condensation domain protein [Streptacidiphilus sp. PB12-B1b]|uniref:condensation domain-containing protein n=1 Tax=Streptacidiphilus sp. PB12-B1b TaxID=2705012 RepID=UPI0015FC07AD|nr:condensation domain-containing protein [Streptacidiphilus sp. PB12-B1b]QMU77425.1 non-ribosomal peptide synthetase condensation domain protein [Streptacidiphilus sp. PB12-B1b]